MTHREVVDQSFAAFLRGDLDAAFDHAVPDFEFDNRTDAPGATGVWVGREGWLEMMGRVTEAFSEYSLRPLEAEEQGNEVVMTVDEFGRGKASGIGIERRIYLTYTFEDTRIVRIRATLEHPYH